MFSHPALFICKVGSDTECKALLAQKNVSAVTGVNGPDCVVLGEVADVSVLFGKLSLGVKTLYKVAVAELVK